MFVYQEQSRMMRLSYLNLNEHWFRLLTWGEECDLVMDTSAAVNLSTLCVPKVAMGEREREKATEREGGRERGRVRESTEKQHQK